MVARRVAFMLFCISAGAGCSSIHAAAIGYPFGDHDNGLSSVSTCATQQGFQVKPQGDALIVNIENLSRLEFRIDGRTLQTNVFVGEGKPGPSEAQVDQMRMRGNDVAHCAQAAHPDLLLAEPSIYAYGFSTAGVYQGAPQHASYPSPVPTAPHAVIAQSEEKPIINSHYCTRMSSCFSDLRRVFCKAGDESCHNQYPIHVGTSDVQCYNMLVNMPYALQQAHANRPDLQVPQSCDLKGEAYTKH